MTSTHKIEFARSGTGSVLARTTRRGNESDLRFNSVSPPLRIYCPMLPFVDGPLKDYTDLPYAAAASVLWAAFWSPAGSAVDQESLANIILDDSAMEEAQQKLCDLQFSTTAFASASAAAAAIAKFVLCHTDEPAFILTDTKTLGITAKTATHAPNPDMSYVDDFSLGMVKTDTCSFVNMGILELVLAPRIIPEQRYDEGLQFMQAMVTLQALVCSKTPGLAPIVAEWKAQKPVPPATDVPMPALLKGRLMRAISSFLRSFSCPKTLLDYNVNNVLTFSFEREDILNDIIIKEYGLPSQVEALVTKHFLSYAAEFPNINTVLFRAHSGTEAFSIISEIKQATCPSVQWDIAGMKAINRALDTVVPQLLVDKHKNKGATERGELIMRAIALGSGPAGAPDGSALPSSAGTVSSYRANDADSLKYARSQQVADLGLTLAPYLATEPKQFVKAIKAISRSQLLFPQQLLHGTRATLVGAPREINAIPGLAKHKAEAMAFVLCASLDTSTNTLSVDDSLQPFVAKIDAEHKSMMDAL